MTLEENKKLVLDHFEALYRLDAEAVRKQLAADFVDHEAPHGSMPPGPDAVLLAFGSVLRAVPDLRVKVEDILAEGDLVAVRGTWTGTHKSVGSSAESQREHDVVIDFMRGPRPPQNVPPTDRATSITGMVFWRIRDGQIVERWGNLDRLSLQKQLSADA
jgi:predicted ester cyclase